MLNTLIEKASRITDVEYAPAKSKVDTELMLKFLTKVKASKSSMLEKVQADLEQLSMDIAIIENQISLPADDSVKASASTLSVQSQLNFSDTKSTPVAFKSSGKQKDVFVPASNTIENMKIKASALKQYKRISEHFNDLQDCYFSTTSNANDNEDPKIGIAFSETFAKFSQFSRLKTLANLHYADSFFNNSTSIVSSIEFDKDDEFFATAGVTRKIKIFEYANVVHNYKDEADPVDDNFIKNAEHLSDEESSNEDDDFVPVDSHTIGAGDGVPRFPVQEISSKSKISCLSWNSYIKTQLLSSDYEGIVTLWDSNTGTEAAKFDEHEKRTWSVDFSLVHPMMFASGGDDTKVKIWSTNQSAAGTTITTKANICSVRFNPVENHQIAFGSADHHIHYYDLRNITAPLSIVRGHRKAVSYVRFINKNEMVSASTDCSLRLWDVAKSVLASNEFSSMMRPSINSVLLDAQLALRPEANPLIRSYQGHLNEKNFVGLSVNSTGEYLACGSETNEVYVYFTQLPKPIAVYPFGNPIDAITGNMLSEEDPTQFVSSVCWKRLEPNVMVAANSQGRIKVLEMV